ncbi:hypothetical protein DIE14_10475 [Burkholderia sp. Bp9017]|nr:hypothetical protein DIE14_10475 [Burkholderia sp. Bp9017]RQZ35455.1 hypothetical protein DIE13_09070 [Burkholderia sp. Bp9016]
MQLASLLPAVFGLVGVVVGAIMTFVRDMWFKSRQETRERQYLAIRVTAQLERFSAGCVAVVADDGLYHGQPDENGVHQAQAQEPTFEPEALQVDWKSMPPDLMYEVLSFPSLIERAKSKIEAEGDHASPPEYEEWFQERQYQYAKLGLQAAEISAKLRARIGLPERPAPDARWDPLQFMTQRRAEIDELRAKWASEPLPFGLGSPSAAPESN